ncbi:MAG TPA: hypothetical protein VJ577_16870 [Burkholderiaceae bacterium]|nr:hypothetical protein [Burkholderiaceae bacterium]
MSELQSLVRANATTFPERILNNLLSSLDGHPHFVGKAREDTVLLVFFLIKFLSHCLDVGSRMADRTFAFLFEQPGQPLEQALQHALYTCLRLQVFGFPQHTVVNELPDVGTGRADVAVVFPTWRNVIEVKRELADASRAGLRAYLGQAASYLLTGPKIGFLVVLDLCSQKDWALTLEDNCWVETVQTDRDSVARKVLVFRIPGCRKPPSSVKTPKDAIY